jgi:Tfp pilus assembly protein PilO
MAAGWRKDYDRYRGFFLDTYSVYKDRKSVKVFLELLLSMTAIAVFAIFALRPTIITIVDLLGQIEAKEEVIATMDTKIQNLATAQAVYAQESRRIALLDSAIPDSSEPHRLIQQVQGVTAKTGLEIGSASVDETMLKGIDKSSGDPDILVPEGSKSLSFSVNAIGAYPQIESFLNDMEKMRRPNIIKIFNIRSLDESGGQVLSISAEGSAIYFDNSKDQ